jgi:hypothetical protein
MKVYWIVLMAAMAWGGCSQVLGLKDPSLEAESDGPPGDGPGSDSGNMPDSGMPDAPGVTNLWVFTTNAQLNGGFGAGGARTAADLKCDEMYRFAYAAKQCTKIRAVVQVDNATDTLDRMSTNYQIPPNAPLLRASDSVKVAEKWGDFVNPNNQLLAAVTPVGSAYYFWSGRGVVMDRQCTNWTSSSNALFGDMGDANLRMSWISAASARCDDLRPHLLCVCW